LKSWFEIEKSKYIGKKSSNRGTKYFIRSESGLGYIIYLEKGECILSKINPFVVVSTANFSLTSCSTLDYDLTGW
jgi:hypothetical protein